MVLLAGLVLVLGPGGDFACLASDDAGTPVVQSPSALEIEFVSAGDADWQVIGPMVRSQLGQSVASAGNVDGYYGDDIIIGAPVKGASQGEGKAYLFLSKGASLSTTSAWEKTGEVDKAYFGQSVAGAGNVNGDEYDDVIIGAPNHKALLYFEETGEWKLVPAGRAFVYEGDPGTGLTIEHTWSYTGTVQDGAFGHAVAGAGDVNGDGIDDIVVGAPGYTDQEGIEDGEGAIYVFLGSEEGLSKEPDWIIDSDQPHTYLGMSVSSVGDVDHDGDDDLIVGAPRYLHYLDPGDPETAVREGAVLLFYGGASPPAGPAWIAYGGQEYSWFGDSVAGAGDVNHDGHPDIVVGAPRYDTPFLGEVGAAFAFCGNGSVFAIEPCWMAFGAQTFEDYGYGTSVGGAGDVNADSYDDVIVGAPNHRERLPDGSQPEGAAFIYFGSDAGLKPWAGWKVIGNKANTDFGMSVSTSGQILISEETPGVIIGAPQYFWDDKEPWGAAFAFYGPLEPGELYRTYLPLVLRNAN